VRTYVPRVRDVATIDSELRLLLAIRRLVRGEEGRTPGTRRIDQLPDERVVETTSRRPPACSLVGLTGFEPATT
jgi:hypothetical protein